MNNQLEIKELHPGAIFSYGGVEWVQLPADDYGVFALAKEPVFLTIFDKHNGNAWGESTLRNSLNDFDDEESFINQLISNGAKYEDFCRISQHLIADDGLDCYGYCSDTITLLTADQYRLWRKYIPLIDTFFWLATPFTCTKSRTGNVKFVGAVGTLYNRGANNGNGGVRPLCKLNFNTVVTRVDNYGTKNFTKELVSIFDDCVSFSVNASESARSNKSLEDSEVEE